MVVLRDSEWGESARVVEVSKLRLVTAMITNCVHAVLKPLVPSEEARPGKLTPENASFRSNQILIHRAYRYCIIITAFLCFLLFLFLCFRVRPVLATLSPSVRTKVKRHPGGVGVSGTDFTRRPEEPSLRLDTQNKMSNVTKNFCDYTIVALGDLTVMQSDEPLPIYRLH